MEWFWLALNRAFSIDPVALGLFLAGLALAFWARRRVDLALDRGLQRTLEPPASGAEVAEEILRATGIDEARVEAADAHFPDYYDPATRTVRLAPAIADGRSLAAVGLSAHEAGHAIQHARRDPPLPLAIRDALAQEARIGPAAALIAMASGFGFGVLPLLHAGMAAFAVAVALPLIGLPIERDASRRARRALAMTALVESDQGAALEPVLDAATWMVVASTLPRLRTPLWRRREPGATGPAQRLLR